MADHQEQVQPQFALQRIYVKDLSFEAPLGYKVFGKSWKPEVKVDLNTKSSPAGDGQFEVLLTVTITAKLEEETAFLVEAQQAGLFVVKGVEGEALRRTLAVACPNILFPYVRETLDNLVVKGGFPALMMAPVNFEGLYLAAMQKQQEEAAAAAAN